MPLTKAKITVEHTGEEIAVMFNPEEYTLAKDNNFASQTIPGLSGPILQFVNGNMRTLTMELFFDTHATRSDVRKETQKLVGLLDIDADLHAPPVLNFAWGSLFLRCVLASVSQQFTMFLEDGRPVRARLSCTFNEFIDPDRESKEVPRFTADFTKVHRVSEGETLQSLAGRYYENPRMWRAIAIDNGIDDPQASLVGAQLRVPRLPYLDPETGEVLQ